MGSKTVSPRAFFSKRRARARVAVACSGLIASFVLYNSDERYARIILMFFASDGVILSFGFTFLFTDSFV